MNEQIKKDENLLNFIGHLGLEKNNPCTTCEFKKGHLSWRCGKCEEHVEYLAALLAAQARVTQYEERQRVVEILKTWGKCETPVRLTLNIIQDEILEIPSNHH